MITMLERVMGMMTTTLMMVIRRTFLSPSHLARRKVPRKRQVPDQDDRQRQVFHRPGALFPCAARPLRRSRRLAVRLRPQATPKSTGSRLRTCLRLPPPRVWCDRQRQVCTGLTTSLPLRVSARCECQDARACGCREAGRSTNGRCLRPCTRLRIDLAPHDVLQNSSPLLHSPLPRPLGDPAVGGVGRLGAWCRGRDDGKVIRRASHGRNTGRAVGGPPLPHLFGALPVDPARGQRPERLHARGDAPLARNAPCLCALAPVPRHTPRSRVGDVRRFRPGAAQRAASGSARGACQCQIINVDCIPVCPPLKRHCEATAAKRGCEEWWDAAARQRQPPPAQAPRRTLRRTRCGPAGTWQRKRCSTADTGGECCQAPGSRGPPHGADLRWRGRAACSGQNC